LPQRRKRLELDRAARREWAFARTLDFFRRELAA
jgi:hypothetical protein